MAVSHLGDAVVVVADQVRAPLLTDVQAEAVVGGGAAFRRRHRGAQEAGGVRFAGGARHVQEEDKLVCGVFPAVAAVTAAVVAGERCNPILAGFGASIV